MTRRTKVLRVVWGGYWVGVLTKVCHSFSIQVKPTLDSFARYHEKSKRGDGSKEAYSLTDVSNPPLNARSEPPKHVVRTAARWSNLAFCSLASTSYNLTVCSIWISPFQWLIEIEVLTVSHEDTRSWEGLVGAKRTAEILSNGGDDSSTWSSKIVSHISWHTEIIGELTSHFVCYLSEYCLEGWEASWRPYAFVWLCFFLKLLLYIEIPRLLQVDVSKWLRSLL